MGLIKAALGAAGGVLADQWKEFFYCDSIDNDILVVKGKKRTSSRSSNTKGEDNIISNGSGIAVADGQCMMIVEQGKVVEFCAEAGEFTWDSSTEPSIFSGSFGDSVKQTFKSIGKRFTYGGDTGKDQRVYYFNTKEIIGNLFGTATPIMFRVVDSRIGLDIDVSLRCSGSYSYKLTDPVLFYTNVCSNVASEYRRDQIDSTLKQEFVSALQPALAELSDMEIRPNQIPRYMPDLEKAMNKALSEKWSSLRGISVVSIAMPNVSLPEEDQELIKTAQKNAMYRDPTMAGATLVGAQADAMKAAASNTNGAMAGFMGMNMAQNAGGMNAQSLFQMGQQNQQAQGAAQAPAQGAPAQGAPAQGAPAQGAPAANSWKCSCGATATGKFCPECGSPKPVDNTWTCTCGTVNKGKFCSECGSPKPAAKKKFKCDKCGWTPEDPENPPKFCPECGDPFNADDAQ